MKAISCIKYLPIAFFCLIWAGGCNPRNVNYQEHVEVIQTSGKNYGNSEQLSKDTYRIDIRTITVEIDYYPHQFLAQCSAEVIFTMYNHLTKPVIHLDAVVRDIRLLQSMELNGELLDLSTDIAVINGIDSEQKALEIQRNLPAGSDHSLKISYRKNTSRNYYILNSQVSDLYGRSNEEIFPTINRFGDLIRHRIRFRVHDDLRFRCLGSGYLQNLSVNGSQHWLLDTEREVPSNTVMFVLVPENDTEYVERVINGIVVRIAAYKNGASIEQALAILSSFLPELHEQFGPFPMPQGYAVFLMNNGGGMEYFGGTISSLNALAHETFHMYVGTSLVLSSYRDSWLDEAINKWYELSAINSISPISDNYSSNLISGFSPVGLGFDRRAYNEGAQIMEHISRAMGGRSQMIGFLHFLIENYSFQPFSTTDFLTYLYDYSGLDYQQHFNSWLYSGETITLSGAPPAEVAEKHHIDLNPPWEILKNYPELTIGGKSCHD